MNRRSMRFRLTVWYTVIMAVTLAAVVLGAYVAMRESINDTVDRELRSRLVAMRAFLILVRHQLRRGAPALTVMPRPRISLASR